MLYPCQAPEFVWNPVCQWWEACLRCGRPAWAHEQADPLQDIRNHIQQLLHGLPPGTYSPAMKTAEADDAA